jgi:hypothetical protein
MENGPVVYLSGPMSGLKDFGRKAFSEAETILKKRGYRVLNPAWLPGGMRYDQYMAISMSMLQQADIICLLPGWKKSKGANAEYALAKSLGLKKFFIETRNEDMVFLEKTYA